MSHAIGTRIEVRGTLTCLGPVHIGGWDTTAEASLTIARDGLGLPFLPGTSLAGAFRAHLAATGHDADTLFGHLGEGPDGGAPSMIRVDDASLDGETIPAVRDGVGIDRRTASAAANFLYTRQVLPAGTTFALRIVADAPPGRDTPVRAAVDALVAALAAGQVPIGAGRGRGHGQVALRGTTVRGADLSDPDDLVRWLTGAVPETPPGPPAAPPPDGRLGITVRWRPAGPLLVRDSMPGAVVDSLPLTSVDNSGRVRLLVPGSSIRGALRAHAERIVRTLRGEDAPDDFGEALKQPPPGVDVLFGFAPGGRRGILEVADCLSTGSVSAAQWQAVLSLSPQNAPAPGEPRDTRAQRNDERYEAREQLRHHLAEIRDAFGLDVSDHVAIDRWTGGAAEHRLFSVLEPGKTVTWEPIRIRADVARGPASVLPLLLLVLRDLRDGWIGLGHGVTRGHGQIEISGITFDGDGLGEPWASLTGRTLDDILDDPPAPITDTMAHWAREMA